DVFLMVRRQKTSILLDAKENTTVHELKKMIAAITKVLPENQQLCKDDEVMENNKILGDYGLNCSTAKPQDPAQVGLAYRESGNYRFHKLSLLVGACLISVTISYKFSKRI
ncbi:Elongin-B, partial [Araneus ventricosus]